MARMTYVEKPVESKTEKRIRIFMAVLFFIQTILTTFPFIQGEDADGYYTYLTAFNMLVQPEGYAEALDFKLAIFGGILVILPIVAFLFCILDRKSNIKYIATGLCSIICAVVVTFGIGAGIGIGAVVTLLFNILTLFLTSMGFLATNNRQVANKA